MYNIKLTQTILLMFQIKFKLTQIKTRFITVQTIGSTSNNTNNQTKYFY